MLSTLLVSVRFTGEIYPISPTTGHIPPKEMKMQGIFVAYDDKNFLLLPCLMNVSALTVTDYILTFVDLTGQAGSVSLTLKPGAVFFSYAEGLLAIEITPKMIEDIEQNGISFEPWTLRPMDSTDVFHKGIVRSVNFETGKVKQTVVDIEATVESGIPDDSKLCQIPPYMVYWEQQQGGAFNGRFENVGSPLIGISADGVEVLNGLLIVFDSVRRKAFFNPVEMLISFLEKVINGRYRKYDIYQSSNDSPHNGVILYHVMMLVPSFELQEIIDPELLADLNLPGGLSVSAVYGDAVSSLKQGDIVISINNNSVHGRAIVRGQEGGAWRSYFSLDQRESDWLTFVREGQTQTAEIKRAPYIHSDSEGYLPSYSGTVPFVQIGPLVFMSDSFFLRRPFRDIPNECPTITVKYVPDNSQFSPETAAIFSRMTRSRVLCKISDRTEYDYPKLWLKKVNGCSITEIAKLQSLFREGKPIVLEMSNTIDGPIVFITTQKVSEEQIKSMTYSLKVEETPRVSSIEAFAKDSKGVAPQVDASHEISTADVTEISDVKEQMVKICVTVYSTERTLSPSTEILTSTGLLIESSRGEIGILTCLPGYSSRLNSIEVTAQQDCFTVLVEDHISLSSGLVILGINNSKLVDKKIKNPTFDLTTSLSEGDSVDIASFSLASVDNRSEELSQTKALVKSPAELRTIGDCELVRLVLQGISLGEDGGRGGLVLDKNNNVLGMVDVCPTRKQGLVTAIRADTLRRVIEIFYQTGFQGNPEHPKLGIVTQPMDMLTTTKVYSEYHGVAIISRHLSLRDEIEAGDLLMSLDINEKDYEIGLDRRVHSVTPPLPWEHFIHMAYVGDVVTLHLKGKCGIKKQVQVRLGRACDLSPYTCPSPDFDPYILVGNLIFKLTPPPVHPRLPKGAIEHEVELISSESIYPQDEIHPRKLIWLFVALDEMSNPYQSYRHWYVFSVNGVRAQDLQHFYRLLCAAVENVQIELCDNWTKSRKIAFVGLQHPRITTNLIMEGRDTFEAEDKMGELRTLISPLQQPLSLSLENSMTLPSLPDINRSVVKLIVTASDIFSSNSLSQSFFVGSGSAVFVLHNTEIWLVTAAHVLYGSKKTSFPTSIEILASDPRYRFVIDGSTLNTLPCVACGGDYDVAGLLLRGGGVIERIREFAKPLILAPTAIEKNTAVLIAGFNGTHNSQLYGGRLNVLRDKRITAIEVKAPSFVNLVIEARIFSGMSGGAVLDKFNRVVAVVTRVNSIGVEGASDNLAFTTFIPGILPKMMASASAQEFKNDPPQRAYVPPIFPFTYTRSQTAGTATQPPTIVNLIHETLHCPSLDRGARWQAIKIDGQRYEITEKGVFSKDFGIHIPPESLIVQKCKPGDEVGIVTCDEKENEKEVPCSLTTKIPFLRSWPQSVYSVMSQTQQQWFVFSGLLVAAQVKEDRRLKEDVSLSREPASKGVVLKEVLPLMRGAFARNCRGLQGARILEIGGTPVKSLSDVEAAYRENAARKTIPLLLEPLNEPPMTIEINNVQSPVHNELAKEQALWLSQHIFFRLRGQRGQTGSILDSTTRELVEKSIGLSDVASLRSSALA